MIIETFTRTFVDLPALDASVAFCKSLLDGEETLRFDYPEAGPRLAAVALPQLSVLKRRLRGPGQPGISALTAR
jgi:hypothetical protein